MANIYAIEEEILRIFDEIESNDGEVTDEQYDALCIKQEELKQKLNNYYKAVQSWESDYKVCKEEEKRIASVRKKYENRIKRLKDVMLQAVQMFGEKGKTGNKFIELPLVRIFTKSSSAVDVNEERINIFISEFERYVRELVNSGIIYTGEDVDLQGILDAINANCKAEQGEDFKPFTLTDLTTMRLEISSTMSIYELFRKGGDLLNAYGHNPITTNIRNATMKEDWKTAITVSEEMNTSNCSVASIVKNKSLQMK